MKVEEKLIGSGKDDKKEVLFKKEQAPSSRLKKEQISDELFTVRAVSKNPIRQLGKDENLKSFYEELDMKMPFHQERPIEENVWAQEQTEVAVKLKKEYDMELAELLVLPLTEKENILKAIQANSAWSAFFDLQAFPHLESFTDNEDFRDHVPYFKACLDLRAEMSVGVGFEITDKTTEETTPQEEFLRKEFDRLHIEEKLVRTQINRDLYGNAYWHLKWIVNSTGKKSLEKIVVVYPPRMRVRLDRRAGNPIIGYAYQPTMFVPGTIPVPVPLETKAVINFWGDRYDDKPYGYSKVKGIKEVLQSRWDINILTPIFFKHYAKPWVHWKLNTEGLQPQQVSTYIDDMFGAMEDAGPDSDMVTSDRWDAVTFSAGNQAKEPVIFTEDMDNQLFGNMKVPETYFKAKGTTDRMILKQDDNFKREMLRIENQFNKQIVEELIKPLLFIKFGPHVSPLVGKESGKVLIDPVTKEPMEKNNYEIPEVMWSEVFEESKEETANRVRADFVAGGITLNEFRKETDRDPLEADQVGELQPQQQEMDQYGQPNDMGMAPGNLGAEPESIEPQEPKVMQPTVNNPTTPQPKVAPPTLKKREVLESSDMKITLEEK